MSNRSTTSLPMILGLLAVFLLLSLADLFLTWKLIHASDGEVIESNPLANWWLTHYGWTGMSIFKLSMFLVVGSMSGIIAYFRPLRGERILVFSCGAQSAVVLYSLFLGGFVKGKEGEPDDISVLSYARFEQAARTRAPRPGLLPDNILLHHLTDEPVQKELKLSKAQLGSLTELADKRKEVAQGFSQLNWDEKNARVQELAAQEKGTLDQLEPDQLKRLGQIAWQQRGHFSFFDPEMVVALQLTTEQNESITTIVEESRKAQGSSARPRGFIMDPTRRAEEDTARLVKQLLTVLTTDQQARWKDLIGEPFKKESLARTGFPPGPPRGAPRSPMKPFGPAQ